MTSYPKYPRYQDYFLRDGKFIGEFEEMYRDFEDPWHQTTRERFASEKAVGINLLQRLKFIFGSKNVVELGCGLGHYTDRIARAGFEVTGLDVSETAITKARRSHHRPNFEVANITDFELIAGLKPDIIVMAEITWYVLGHLQAFRDFLRCDLPDTFLLHLLVCYPPGVQQYGTDYFTDLEGIKQSFGMTYLEWGEVHFDGGERRTWFLGTWRSEKQELWSAES